MQLPSGPALRRRWLLAAILLAATLPRVLTALYLGDVVEVLPGTADQVSYHTVALRVLDGHGFTFAEPWWPLTGAGEPTAHWSYLYTLYLVGVYALFGPHPLAARLIQALIAGLLQPLLAYFLGRHIFDERAGLWAAALTAGYAYFIYYAGVLMTEAFYVVVILGVLYLALRLAEAESGRELKWALALGLLLGVAVLLRQLIILFIPFLFLWLWWVRFRERGRVPLAATLSAGLVIVAMILPFTFYNYIRFDRFVLLNTNAGYAFFWANHPIYGTQFEPILPAEMGSYLDLVPRELIGMDEAALDQALLVRGLQFVVEDPVRYILLSLSRIPAYFMFWPSPESGTISNVARVISFGLLWPFMAIGLVRAFFRSRRLAVDVHGASLLALFAAVYTAIHLLSWALIRYRLPVDAVLMVFAGLAVGELIARLRARLPARLRPDAAGR